MAITARQRQKNLKKRTRKLTTNAIPTLGMRQKLKYQDVQVFVCGFWHHVGRIVNYVTRVAAKNTSKKTNKIGILINASSLTCNPEKKAALYAK
jgi:hypothetical protein